MTSNRPDDDTREIKTVNFSFLALRDKVLKQHPDMAHIKDAKTFCANIPGSVNLTIFETMARIKIANGKRVFSDKWHYIHFDCSIDQIDYYLSEIYHKVYGNLKGRPKGTTGAYKKPEERAYKITLSIKDQGEELVLRKIQQLLRDGMTPLEVLNKLEADNLPID